jgi:phosphoglycolate phosphatase-like HAD superfamily hydrolase
MIFVLPLNIVFLLYTLDVSYLTDEVEKGGTIAESNPPPDAKDLSDVTLIQSCVFVCAMPCILCIQSVDLVRAVKRVYDDNYKDQPFCGCGLPDCFRNKTTEAGEKKQLEPKKPKKRTVWFRIYRTLVRCFTGARHKPTVQPSESSNGLALKELDKDREREEREQREKISKEQEEERQRIALKEAEANAEFLRRQEDEEKERLRLVEERRLAEERVMQEKKEAEEFANRWESVLSVTRYKALWATLTTSGSFQCNLKVMPALNTMTDHLKRQGFHVVFAASANSQNIEVGICNVRPVGEENWFTARFLVSNNGFSAVMKATSADSVPNYVKKFALAKILKIEAAK